MPSGVLAARIWLITSVVIACGILTFLLFCFPESWYMFIPAFLGLMIGGFPVFILLTLVLPFIKRIIKSFNNQVSLTILLCGVCAFLYGIVLTGFSLPWNRGSDVWSASVKFIFGITGILFTGSLITLWFSQKQLQSYFTSDTSPSLSNQQLYMEQTNYAGDQIPENKSSRSNRILIKGAVTAALIGIMMIPTVYISELVRERQSNQEAVVKEVNSRWSEAQTLTGPYIYLPYKVTGVDATGKPLESTQHIVIIPDNLHVTGQIDHEIRVRSIYKVLLYRASLANKGDIVLQIPKELSQNLIQWQDARICFGISDFKGIEEKLLVQFNGVENELSPGLPSNEVAEKGLSAPVVLSSADIGKPLAFSMNIKIKGSEMLHFVPLSGNSDFTLRSTWPNPSFDGNNLPTERTVSPDGFTAKWVFNKANLPFGTVLKDFKFDPSALAFGVTMVQPADQYAKTNRSVKYAILVIGLTFSLFFIIELMQQKPIHPVQYVLIGLGLVIFYSLLLAISEFIAYDLAYLIASVSTILLIGLYAQSHFKSWKSAGIFTGVLTLLYGFIFILIRLEDTALLVGSIGLFIILAITMYASKKVDWYGQEKAAVALS
jgi:inner membrane protein